LQLFRGLGFLLREGQTAARFPITQQVGDLWKSDPHQDEG
jgi:hypothetical protein